MNSQSIEFQTIKEDINLSETIRTAFRVPVGEVQNVFLVINKIQYSVADISPGGFGICLEDNSMFSVGEIIDNCELHIFDQKFENLKIKIVHFSTGTIMPLQCGIQLVDFKKQSYDQLNKIILKMKDQLLK
jgi:hypothetical protein